MNALAHRRLPSDEDTVSSASSSDASDDDDRPLTAERTKPAPSSSKTGWIVAGLLAVLLVAAGVLAVVLYNRQASPATAPATTAESAATPERETASHSSQLPSSPNEEDGEAEGDGGSRGGHSRSGQGGPTQADDTRTAAPSSTSTPQSSSPSGNLPPLVGEQLLVDFTTFSSSDTVESFLTSSGLTISDWPVEFTPIPVIMAPGNVDIVDGALRLKVTAGTEPVVSAEVVTKEEKILYGRVTMRAKASPVPGVCHGIFFYGGPTLEVDIELLSSYYTEGRGDSVKPGIQFTNHPLTEGEEMYNEVYPYGFDPTADFHDYTIEWTEDTTIFSIDGAEIATFTRNVPTGPMAFNWNSWSSGEPNWSAGPPEEDSYFSIQGMAGNWTTG
ncbi:glycoside hydrolase family 16 protein [Rhodotorula paludigena]|uniref:glycoside hydrolase family 16 protein n=1 Tax=Rhodotorula paludigena TaxID=86838 RepID=UPI003182A2B9